MPAWSLVEMSKSKCRKIVPPSAQYVSVRQRSYWKECEYDSLSIYLSIYLSIMSFGHHIVLAKRNWKTRIEATTIIAFVSANGLQRLGVMAADTTQ